MVTMYKANRTKDVPEWDVKGQMKNGWTLGEGEISARLRPAKKNAEETPAAEETSSEQGDVEANLEENEDE